MPIDISHLPPPEEDEPSNINISHLPPPDLNTESKLEDEDSLQTALDYAKAAGQSAAFDFGDELYGAIGALANKTPQENWQDVYERYRDIARQNLKESAERSPSATVAGQITGALVPINILSKAKLAAKLGKAVTKTTGKSILGRIAGAGAEGSVFGGASALGSSEATSTPDMLEDVRQGALSGGIISGAIPAAIPAAKAIQKGTTALAKNVGFIGDVGTALTSDLLVGTAGLKKLGREVNKSTKNLINTLDLAESGAGKELDDLYKLHQNETIDFDSYYKGSVKALENLENSSGLYDYQRKQITDTKNKLKELIEGTEIPVPGASPAQYTRVKGAGTAVSPETAGNIKRQLQNLKQDLTKKTSEEGSLAHDLPTIVDDLETSLRENYYTQFPKIGEANEQFSVIKQLKEILGKSSDINVRKARTESGDISKIRGTLTKEGSEGIGQLEGLQRVDEAVTLLKDSNLPDKIKDTFLNRLAVTREKIQHYSLGSRLNKPFSQSGVFGGAWNTVLAATNIASNLTVKPTIKGLKTLFEKASPQDFKQMSQNLTQKQDSKTAQHLSDLMNKLADNPSPFLRNATVYTIMQNPEYKNALGITSEEEEE